MHPISVTQAFVLGLLASAPIAASFATPGAQDLQGRYVVSLLNYMNYHWSLILYIRDLEHP